MIYNVGDIITIKHNLRSLIHYGGVFVNTEMINYKGMKAEIVRKDKENLTIFYHIKIVGYWQAWSWTAEMFEETKKEIQTYGIVKFMTSTERR